MIIVTEAFDDNSATLFNTNCYETMTLPEGELIKFSRRVDIYGLSVGDRGINYINSYKVMQFDSEELLDEYIRENNLPYQNKKYTSGNWWYFKKKNTKVHVDYYVVTYRGDEITYVAEKSGYTPYIQAAKSFSKAEAGKKAALMTQKSKTKTYWTTLRVECR